MIKPWRNSVAGSCIWRQGGLCREYIASVMAYAAAGLACRRMARAADCVGAGGGQHCYRGIVCRPGGPGFAAGGYQPFGCRFAFGRHTSIPASLSAKQHCNGACAWCEVATFPSMVVYGQQNVLAEIQAAEAGYPLRGKDSH